MTVALDYHGASTRIPGLSGRPRPRAGTHLRTATIDVENLRLRTFIGFNPEEREKQQDVVINVTIRHRLNPRVATDAVDAALDYKAITKRIIRHVEAGRFLLLEKLTGDVLDICCADPAVEYARVRIDKPHALRFADSVSVTLEYDASDRITQESTS